MQIPLIRGDTVDSSVDYRDQLPVNMVAINRQIKGAAGYMMQWYGLTEVYVGSGVSRGAKWVSSSDNNLTGHYRVSGGNLVEVADGQESTLGGVGGTEQASIAASFNNVAVVSGGRLYYYNRADGFREISGSFVGSPIDICWVDNVFVLTDGINVYHSNPLDEEEFLATDFTNPQFKPDRPLGVAVTEDNELAVFQAETTEFFLNTGGENFLFTRITNKAIDLGVVGTHAKTYINGDFYVVSTRNNSAASFSQVIGGGDQKLASREIEKVLAEYSAGELLSVTMDSFTRDAVDFVAIHLPSHCLLFNIQAAQKFGQDNAWSILKSDAAGDTPWRAKDIVQDKALGKWIAGDKQGSTVGYIDDSVATHYGEIAEWILFSPLIGLDALSIDMLELQTIPGYSPSNDAKVFISRTENDGVTFGKEWTVEYGKNLDYNKRMIARRLGYVRNYMGLKFRGANRSRANICFLNLEAS